MGYISYLVSVYGSIKCFPGYPKPCASSSASGRRKDKKCVRESSVEQHWQNRRWTSARIARGEYWVGIWWQCFKLSASTSSCLANVECWDGSWICMQRRVDQHIFTMTPLLVVLVQFSVLTVPYHTETLRTCHQRSSFVAWSHGRLPPWIWISWPSALSSCHQITRGGSA